MKPEADGITVAFVKDSIIENNFVYNSTEEGVVLYDTVRVKVRNNYLENCGTLALSLNPAIEVKDTEFNLPCYDNEITYNTLIGSKRAGIFVYGAYATQVIGNTISDTSLEVDVEDSSASAIYITGGVSGSSDNIVVKDNKINNSRYFGILAQAYGSIPIRDLVVSSNTISNARMGVVMKSSAFNERSTVSLNNIINTTYSVVFLNNVTGVSVTLNHITDCPMGATERRRKCPAVEP